VTPTIRLSRMHFPTTALGPGVRLGVWVQGCALACPGCMSRDTWDPAQGQETPLEDVVAAWREARVRGAVGITLSGGEPAEQPQALAELIHRVRVADADLATAASAPPLDVLVLTGLDEPQLTALAPGLATTADAAIVGRFDVTKPTDLVWRGSANQRLLPLTSLGAERYAPYMEARTASPAIQFAVDDDRIWTIGVPRIGDLPVLERRLRAHGIESGGVSWRS
jgi:anaerobic ribonucleoside-triphosphate reductase activating protein